jgi:hypothetical protein
MPKIKTIFFSIFLWIILLLLPSCMPGYKVARQFIQHKDEIAVMIVPNNHTFLNYYPFDEATYPDFPDESADIADSHLLKDTDTDQADRFFLMAITDHLMQYNIKVFGPDEFDQFLSHNGDRFIFTLAQTELIEYDRTFTDRALIDTILYQQNFLQRTMERNSWFEFVKVDEYTNNTGMQVLYNTFFVSDEINGRFRYRAFTGEVYYEYSFTPLTVNDVYAFNHDTGTSTGRQIFEFLLNRHVKLNRAEGKKPPVYFRYNPVDKSLRRSRENQGFIIIENQNN